MRDFFEDLGKRIGETAETLSSKAGEVVEIQKIKNQIRTLENGNDRDFQDIGLMIYEKYKAGETVDPDMASLCDAIKERESSMVELNKQLSEAKGANECTSCGCYVEKGMSFCPYCGAKITEPAPADDIFEEETTDSSAAEKVEDVVDDVKDAAANTAEKIAEDAKAATEAVKDAMDDVAE